MLWAAVGERRRPFFAKLAGTILMQIKMLHSMASATFTWSPGDVVDVTQAEARRLIKAGFAEFVGTAKKATAENATSKAAASRAKRTAS